MKKILSVVVFLCVALQIAAQNDFAHEFSRPLSDVMKEISERFGAKFRYKTDTAGVVLTYADYRLRPYSLEETLHNVLTPLGLSFYPDGDRYRIQPFHYPRRRKEDGARLLSYLSGKYENKEQWELRRDSLKADVRRRLGIDEWLKRCSDKPAEFGKVRRHDGYAVQNFRIETVCPPESHRTGGLESSKRTLHLCGTIYWPDSKNGASINSKKSRMSTSSTISISSEGLPLIICPAGHFAGGRYNPDLQKRYATLARMGAIAVSYDIYGWGESEDEVGRAAHETDTAHIMQTLHGIRVLDMMLSLDKTRKSKPRNHEALSLIIDKTRIGCNGGSGGGSQVVLLTLLDERYTAACPTVSMSAWFDGGCPCESGRPIHLAVGGSCNPELAATFAPRPMHIISDSGDWTCTMPESEFPFIQRIYGFYDAEGRVGNTHLMGERHDFGPNKRQAVYDFFADIWNLDKGMIDEEKVAIESEETLRFSPKKP